ncbi:MAG: major facilitator superfamily 1, partial [Pseudonocardia sp.]|nr:major facilitator superfamily 1 [Pseudonocardia sp.]
MPNVASLAPPQERLGWRGLFSGRPFRRLVLLRIAAQWGDGMFQAALGGAVLFNPERQADPTAVAAGLAVLLLPYSLVGPFAGALLDRWDRRRVLVAANLLRGVFVLVVAGMLATGVAGPALYLGALTVAGVSRFVLAGLSAALPDIVERRHLVEANVVAATVGAATTALGAACAIGLRGLLGAGDGGSSLVTTLAVVGSIVAAVLAARYRPGALGPLPETGPGTAPPQRTLVAVAHGLVDGARAVAAVPSVAASFAALAAHRLAF